MRHGVLLLLSLALLIACGDDPAGTDDGPLSLAVISGDSQVVQAGSGQLPEPVVGRLVRLPSGRIAWSPLDLLARPAYAQTVVQGSPVPGAVVCAVPLTEGGIKPFTPCTNTASDGTATFFFEAGTRAGEHIAEIRGTVDQQPAVFDSVTATIKPGVAIDLFWRGSLREATAGDTLDFSSIVAFGLDQYGNHVPPEEMVTTVPLHTALVPSTSRICDIKPDEPTATGWKIYIPEEVRDWPVTTNDGINACLWVWLFGRLGVWPLSVR